MIHYYSIHEPVTDELEIKKSRFITYLFPIQAEADFNSRLDNIRKEHYKANHHCYAYILEDQAMVQRMSDDGEPSGTAGVPMLEVLKLQELTYIMAVTVRYFGGIKLGTGGLIRAYSSAVSQALSKAQKIANVDQLLVDITHDYAQIDSFNRFLQTSPLPVNQLDTEYTDSVIQHLAISPEDGPQIQQELMNLFAGQLNWQAVKTERINVPINSN